MFSVSELWLVEEGTLTFYTQSNILYVQIQLQRIQSHNSSPYSRREHGVWSTFLTNLFFKKYNLSEAREHCGVDGEQVRVQDKIRLVV